MPARRRRFVEGSRPGIALPLKTVAEWEQSVFLDASHFSVALFIGHGRFDRQHFEADQFPAALAAARAPGSGRPRMLYVISKAGRSVCLESAKDQLWTALWEQARADGKGLDKRATAG
jgi:hypothetical protein